MKDAWAVQMRERLRRAKANPPTAEVLRPIVEGTVRRVALAATQGGRKVSLRTDVRAQNIMIGARGRDQAEVLAFTRQQLSARRREMIEAVRQDAQAKLRGV